MSSTKQPVWRYRGNLGDASPLTEHAAFVYEDITGVYSPEMVLFNAPATIKIGTKYKVHRIMCEKCYYTDGVLSDNRFHKDKPAWFKVKDVANVHGAKVQDVIDRLCSDDILDRCAAYQMLVNNYGVVNFDSYPVLMTRTELRRRYRAPFRHGSYPV